MTNAPARPTAFDERLMSKLPQLRRFACYLVSPDRREDLVQEAVAIALRDWQKFRPDGGFVKWLQYVMRHIVQNERRRFAPTLVPLGEHAAPHTDIAAALDARAAIKALAVTRKGRMAIAYGMCGNHSEVGRNVGMTSEGVRQAVLAARADIAEAA